MFDFNVYCCPVHACLDAKVVFYLLCFFSFEILKYIFITPCLILFYFVFSQGIAGA